MSTRTGHLVERLTNNERAYTANETRPLGDRGGRLVRTTPAYSPESNGLAEAFVKTFNRDYVYLPELPTGRWPVWVIS